MRELIYSLLALAVLSFWFLPRYVGLCLSGVACGLALFVGALGVTGLILLIAMGVLLFLYYHKPSMQKALLVAIFALGAMMLHHWLPGLPKWEMFSGVQLSRLSRSFDLRFYIESPVFACLFLTIIGGVVRERKKWLEILKKLPWDLLLTAVVLAPIMYAIDWVALDPKVPAMTPIWAARNLLFVALPEECLFRAFLQQELQKRWSAHPYGNIGALLLTSLLFGIFHYQGGLRYIFLTAAGGICFGLIYNKRKTLESVVLIHFFINFFHFILFTYPVKK
jgi:uncharacterized protein